MAHGRGECRAGTKRLGCCSSDPDMAPGSYPGNQDCLSFPSMFLYLNVDKVPLLPVIECEFVFLGSESLVVVEQGLNLFCQVNQSNGF